MRWRSRSRNDEVKVVALLVVPQFHRDLPRRGTGQIYSDDICPRLQIAETEMSVLIRVEGSEPRVIRADQNYRNVRQSGPIRTTHISAQLGTGRLRERKVPTC